MRKPLVLAGLALAIPSSVLAQDSLTHISVSVESTNTVWTPTGITVAPGDILVVQAAGEISVGPYVKRVNADGVARLDYAGALEVKVGIHPGRRVGGAGCVFIDQSGQVRLRVHDFRHEDNVGSFEVRVLHIPRQVIPAPMAVDP